MMTIEHLLPQSYIDGTHYTDHAVGCLGNLILVSPEMNQKLSDKTFNQKKQTLNRADYNLDTKVASSRHWDIAEIEDRFKWMADEAYRRHWRI